MSYYRAAGDRGIGWRPYPWFYERGRWHKLRLKGPYRYRRHRGDLMSAISGAIGGFSAGGPVGGLIGAVSSFVPGLDTVGQVLGDAASLLRGVEFSGPIRGLEMIHNIMGAVNSIPSFQTSTAELMPAIPPSPVASYRPSAAEQQQIAGFTAQGGLLGRRPPRRRPRLPYGRRTRRGGYSYPGSSVVNLGPPSPPMLPAPVTPAPMSYSDAVALNYIQPPPSTPAAAPDYPAPIADLGAAQDLSTPMLYPGEVIF